MLSLAFFPVIIELYGAIIKWQGSLSTIIEKVLSSPRCLDLLEQLKVWRDWILSVVHDVSASPIILETIDKCSKWYSSSSALLKVASTDFLEKNPTVKARGDLFIKNMITISQDVMIYLYGKGEKLLKYPALQSIVRRPAFQNLANHPLMQKLYEHPNIQETYAVKTANHVTEDTMQNFLKTISLRTFQAQDDPSKVTMNLASQKSQVNNLVQNMETMKNDTIAADNFVWICTFVLTMVAVTSLSWLAILLSSRGIKYRRSVNTIAYIVSAILAAFFLALSFKLRSVDEDAHTMLKYLLACSYIPFLFLIAVVYFRTWGNKPSKEQTKEAQLAGIDHEKAVGELKKQMQDIQSANLKTINDKDSAHEMNRLSLEESERSSVELKSRLLAMSADLAAARTNEEIALKLAETAQKQVLTTPTKTVILQMDMDTSDGGMMMPGDTSRSAQSQSRTRGNLSQITPDAMKSINVQQDEKDLESIALQEELTKEHSSRIKAEASVEELQKQVKDVEVAHQATTSALEQAKVLTAGQKTRLQALRADLTALQAEKEKLIAEKAITFSSTADITLKLTAAKAELVTLTEQFQAEGTLRLSTAKQGDTYKMQQELLTTNLRSQLVEIEKAEAIATTQILALQTQAKTIGEENEKVKSELQSKLNGLQDELTLALSSKDAILQELEVGKKQMTVLIAEKDSTRSITADMKKESVTLTNSINAVTSELQTAMQTNAKVNQELNGQITVLKQKVEDITQELSTVIAAKEIDSKNLEQSNRNLVTAQANLTAIQTEKEALSYELEEGKKNLEMLAAEKENIHNTTTDMTSQLEIIAAARQADSAREIKGLNGKLRAVQEELATERELLYVKVDSLTDRLNATEEAKVAALLAVDEAEKKLSTTQESLAVSEAAREDLSAQLVSTNAILAVSENLQNDLSEETTTLKSKCEQLELDLEKASNEAASHKITLHSETNELQSKLAGSRESLRLATLDCTSTRELTKSTAEDYQRQLSEKTVEITTLGAALREAEAARTVVLREGEETKARLTAQIAKNAVDIANNEEELRDMEISLKSFLDVCNSTRVSLVSAQDDLKVSELRRVEDSAAFEIKLKDAEQAKITLVDQCESGRVKLVALEVEAMSAASTGETGLDKLKNLLEASEDEKKRVTSLAEDLKLSLSTAKEELKQQNERNKMEIIALHAQLDTLQIEKQTSTTQHDAIAVRLTNALEEIKFFEKERSEDITSVQRELKESARARKEIVAEFEIAKKDLNASGNVLLNSQSASPIRGPSGTFTPVTPPVGRTPDRSRSPILSAIETAVLKQMIDDLTVSCEAATANCKKLQKELDVALQDLEICETQRTMQVEQMQQALEALEALEEERESLINECNRLRTKLGMSPHTENILNGSDEALRIQDDEKLAVTKMASLSSLNVLSGIEAEVKSKDDKVLNKDQNKDNKDLNKDLHKDNNKDNKENKDKSVAPSAPSTKIIEEKSDAIKGQKSPGKSKSKSDKKKKSRKSEDSKARSEKSLSTSTTSTAAPVTVTAAAIALSNIQPQIDDKGLIGVEEKRTSSILSQPARPISLIRSSSNSSRDSAFAINPTDAPPGDVKKPPAPQMPNASMANITSNPMLAPSVPRRARDTTPTGEGIVNSGPKPLIMSSASLWANSKTLAMMSRLGKRKNSNESMVPVPFAPITNQKSKKTDHPNESVNSDIEALRKVKQTLEQTLQSANTGVEAVNARSMLAAANTAKQSKDASSNSNSSGSGRGSVNGGDSLSNSRRALEEDEHESKEDEDAWDIKAHFSHDGTPAHIGSPIRPTDLDVPGGMSISADSSGPPSSHSNELAAGKKANNIRSQETLSECDDANKVRGDAPAVKSKKTSDSSAGVTTPLRKNTIIPASDENINLGGSLNHHQMHPNITTPVPPSLEQALSKKSAAEPKIGSPQDQIPSPKLAAFLKKNSNSRKNFD